MWRSPLTAEYNERLRRRVLENFPALSSCGHDAYLALAKYVDGTPERFYSRECYATYAELLDREFAIHPTRLIDVLNENVDDVDRAILILNELAREEWHDTPVEEDEYAFMRLCDRNLHPAYLKLAEGVLHRIMSPLATCLRLDRGKSTDDLWKLSACVNEMNRASCASLVAHCDSVVRNSIAHGRVTYRQRDVLYYDRNGKNRKLARRAVVEMVDGLMDACQGCVLALKLFYRQHLSDPIEVPRQVMLEERQADTKAPWWEIEGCLASELPGKSQLVIYARPTSRDYYKVQYMAVYTGILAEHFAPGFDRYFVSLRSPLAWPGFAAFNGQKLREIRMRPGARSMEEYRGVLEDGLVFFRPKMKLPRVLCRLETFLISLRFHLPLGWDDVRRELQETHVAARRAQMHRNGWGALLEGSVVVDIECEDDPQGAVRKACRRIIKVAARLGRRSLKWSNIAKYLPLGYARIAVFQSDRRHRALYGLDPDLVCTVQIQRISRIKAPDIAGSTIEMLRPYRIAWNKAWLDGR